MTTLEVIGMKYCPICKRVDIGGQVIHGDGCPKSNPIDETHELKATAARWLVLLKEMHYVIENEPLICPVCGQLACSDDCELAVEVTYDNA